MTHFSDLEMHRWRESGPNEDRARVIAHIAECADCASRYAAAIRNRPRRAEPAEGVDDFVAAGRRVAATRTWMMPLAVAAAALIALITIPLTFHRESGTPDLHLRGAAIQLLAPAGAVRADELRFVWAAGVAASRYHVEIGEGDHIIDSADVNEQQFVMPVSLRATLEPGVEYWWMVSALDERGQRVTSSPRRTFTIVR